jgi:hypothetical protein
MDILSPLSSSPRACRVQVLRVQERTRCPHSMKSFSLGSSFRLFDAAK